MTLHFRPGRSESSRWAERRSGSGFSSCRARACSTSPGRGRCSATRTRCSAAPPTSWSGGAARAGHPDAHGLVVGGIRPLPRSGARLPDVAIVAGAPVRSAARGRRAPGALAAPVSRAHPDAWSRSARAPSCWRRPACSTAAAPPRTGCSSTSCARASRRPRRRRRHLRQGSRRLDVGGDHRRHRSDAGAGRGGPRPPRGDGGRQAAGAVPAPFGEPGAVQRGAAPAGEGAAAAARHLDVRPRSPRRAAAGRADRAAASA